MAHPNSLHLERPGGPDEDPEKPGRPEITPPDEPSWPRRATPEHPEVVPQRSPSIYPESPPEVPGTPEVPGIEPEPGNPDINPG